jgi:hypothetical protein
MHSAIPSLHVLKFPNDAQFADRYLVVAICRFDWLCSRKYGTIWYHPTSSRFYLTIFILCQFQGKLTVTLRIRQRVLSQLVRLAVCLAWDANQMMWTSFLHDNGARKKGLLTDKRRIHLRSASVRPYTFLTMGFPRFLSIRGARGLQMFDLPLLTNIPKP